MASSARRCPVAPSHSQVYFKTRVAKRQALPVQSTSEEGNAASHRRQQQRRNPLPAVPDRTASSLTNRTPMAAAYLNRSLAACAPPFTWLIQRTKTHIRPHIARIRTTPQAGTTPNSQLSQLCILSWQMALAIFMTTVMTLAGRQIREVRIWVTNRVAILHWVTNCMLSAEQRPAKAIDQR